MKSIYLLFLTLLFCAAIQAQNTALRFDGTAESVTITNKPILNITDEYTIEAWIFAEEWKSLSWQGSIFTNDAHGTGDERGFAFRCGDNGKLSYVMGAGSEWNEVVSPSVMNEKQWHHVAAVVNNGTVTLYIDGQPAGSGTYPVSPTPCELAFTIGESTGFPGRVFNGIIDELRVWNVARTATQLADNATVDLTGSESGLIAYFPLNEGSGTTAGNRVDPSSSGTLLEMDNSNWVDGYTLPDFDVSVKNIGGIDRVNMTTRPIRISAEIQNVGTMSISDVEATIYLNGEEEVSETLEMTLLAGEALDYKFITPINLIDINNPEIEVVISHPDDANALNNSATKNLVTKQESFVNIFDREQHNFGSAGQNQTNTMVLPGDLSGYETLLLHIAVECPTGGCDPWDQAAQVWASNENGNMEIARYITPYGIACGPWTVDVTDFKSVLTGEVTFTSFVQVFGQSGWLVTIDLEMIEGISDYPHSKVTSIYQDDYHVYGDPGIEDDLDPVSLSVAGNTETSHLRVQVTGHGQGNTNNAAEFFAATHEVMVNGSKLADHFLWKDDCALNTCADQLGNWLFSRAGWCPGQEVIPAFFNTTDALNPGDNAEFDYELQDYTNLLNTGYNNSGHTEPFYRIHTFLVENSTSRFAEYTNLATTDFAYQVENLFITEAIGTIKNEGSIPVTNFTMKIFNEGELISEEDVEQTLMPGDEYDHFFDINDFGDFGGTDVYVEVLAEGDQNSGDNIYFSNIVLVSSNDVEVLSNFTISPNPSGRTINVNFENNLFAGQMLLYSVEGRVITQRIISNHQEAITVNNSGTYFIKVTDSSGKTATKKVIVIE
ncbi:MAG: LamG-like jellyroll fold domain-containing protein [Bacteroidota bacterium]